MATNATHFSIGGWPVLVAIAAGGCTEGKNGSFTETGGLGVSGAVGSAGDMGVSLGAGGQGFGGSPVAGTSGFDESGGSVQGVAGAEPGGGSGMSAGGGLVGNGGSGQGPGAAGPNGGGEASTGGFSGGGEGGHPNGGPGTDPVGDWGPGDYPPDINAQTYLEISGVPGQGSLTRQYKVHVPPTYDPRVPAPLVFCIHGLAQNPVMFCVVGAEMNKKSDAAGFILVMPNGYQASWNAGTCCGGASNERLDDVALFRAIFAEVDGHLNIDHRRVYATGLSNGGYMSYRLACNAADMFAAVAPVAGAIGINTIGGGTNPASDFTTCNPSEPVSILDIHGTSDFLIPYSLQASSLTLIAGENGCGASTAPAPSPESAGDTTCVAYSDCPAGVKVIGCSIQGGGHCWFGSADCGTGGGAIGAAVVGANSDTMINNDAVWEFFSHLSK